MIPFPTRPASQATLLLAAVLAWPAQAQPTEPAPASDAQQLAKASAPGGLPCGSPQPSQLQRRLIAEAARGQDALLRYVHRTRMIHELEPVETVRWTEAMRQDAGQCRSLVAAVP
jgi:hypothetical protein